MSDELFVGTPGRMGLATSALERESIVARESLRVLRDALHRLEVADRIVADPALRLLDAPYSAVRAEEAIAAGCERMRAAADHAERIATALPILLARAEAQEERMRQEFALLASRLAWLGGAVLPVLVVLALPTLIGAGLSAGAAWLLLSEEQKQRVCDEAGRWWEANRALLSSPAFVDAVRLAVANADDAASGLARMPPGLAGRLGEGGRNLLGVDTSAAALFAAGALTGVLRETAVRVEIAAKAGNGVPAADLRTLADRIPADDDQIRIDRITGADGQERFEVFLAGTVDLGIGGNEPWDMRSNLGALAGGDPASLRAVEAAMRAAGIDGETPVTFVGYSQGGLLAARLAASGDWHAAGLVTFGAPAGQVPVPEALPYLAIEHRDDLVPALGGDQVSAEPLIVRRQVFDAPPVASESVPAHLFEHYRETAALADGSDDPRVRELIARLLPPVAGSAETTWFRAIRES